MLTLLPFPHSAFTLGQEEESLPALRPVVCAIFAASFCHAAPVWIDWEDGQWTHGVTTYIGFQQPTALPGVGTPYVATTNGGNVLVQWIRYGTATGAHSGIGGIQPRVSAAFAGASTDGAISMGTAGDYSPSAMNNYVALSIAFTQAVNVLPFVIGDVDRTSTTGTAWEDFIAVVANNGAAPVPVAYTRSPSYNALHTRFGLAGVLGTASALNTSDQGNVVIGPSGPITQLIVYFMQGPNGTGGSAHGVFIRDIGYEPVQESPEPGTALLSGVTLCGFLMIYARRSGTVGGKTIHATHHSGLGPILLRRLRRAVGQRNR